MPFYRYTCEGCKLEFEELLMSKEEIRDYSEECPCPQCRKSSSRIKVDSFSFGFKSKLPNGNSGAHAVDYPSLDVAVGRSASKKWEKFHEEKSKRDKARRELGTNSVTEVGGRITATSPKVLDLREKGSRMFKKVNKKIP